MFVIFVYSAATLLQSYSGHTAIYTYSEFPATYDIAVEYQCRLLEVCGICVLSVEDYFQNVYSVFRIDLKTSISDVHIL